MTHQRRVQRDPDGQMRRGHEDGLNWYIVPNDYYQAVVDRIIERYRGLLDRLAQY